MATNIRKKRGKQKKKIRRLTRNAIIFMAYISIFLSIIVLYNNIFNQKKIQYDEKFYEYTEEFNQKYDVKLKSNKYMEDESILENEGYVSELIKDLELAVKYNYHGEKAERINCTYKINGILKTSFSSNGNETNIWNKEYTFLEEKSKISDNEILEIDEKIDIDLGELNDLVLKFKEEMEMAVSSKLEIIFEANINAYVDDQLVVSKYNNKLEVSVGDKVTVISGKLTDTNKQEKTKQVEILKRSNNGVNVALLIVVFVSIYKLYRIKTGTKVKNSITNIFKTELNQILSYYDDKIVRISSRVQIIEDDVIDVNDINELFKLSEEMYKPILLYEFTNKNEAWFYINNENNTYRFILK